jgi:hypothetical protein
LTFAFEMVLTIQSTLHTSSGFLSSKVTQKRTS